MKKLILQKIAQDDLNEVFRLLRKVLRGTSIFDKVINMENIYRKIEDGRITGLKNVEEYQDKKNELIFSLIGFVNSEEFSRHVNSSDEMMPTQSARPITSIFTLIFNFIFSIPRTIWSIIIFPFHKLSDYLNKSKFQNSIKNLKSLSKRNDEHFYEITYIRANNKVSISLILDLDFEEFDEKQLEDICSQIKKKLTLKKKLKAENVKPGSVIITFELNSKDAENLFLAVKTGKLANLNVNEATLIEYRQKDVEGKFDLKEIKEKLLKEIADDFEKGIQSIYEILNTSSLIYNDFVQLKSSSNQTKKLFSQGLIDYPNFKIDMNKSIQFSISLVNQIIGKDLNENTATNNA